MSIYNPVSTYRLQFNDDFGFEDAQKILPYLHKLGIKTLYASPVFRAVSGSTHGYDVADPTQFSPGIGTLQSFLTLRGKMKGFGMGWLQDIVPNHMGFSHENPWVRDLLVKGKESAYYSYFDIFEDHPDPELRKGIMIPFLGKSLEEVLEAGEISLHLGEKGFFLKYFTHVFPVSMRAYPAVLEAARVPDKPQIELPALLEDIVKGEVEAEHWDTRTEQFYSEYLDNRECKLFIDHCLERINGDPALLSTITRKLSYLPVYWQETEKRINYRRFFTINGLICINIQTPEVFDRYHRKILEGVKEGWYQGLRIDHIDGLYDPVSYLERLRNECGEECMFQVEKILESGEELPNDWPVQGTTGYDFLAQVNNLLTRKSEDFYRLYNEWTGSEIRPTALFLEKKRFILHNRLKGELDLLTRQCIDTGWFGEDTYSGEEIRAAIGGFLVHCPVYKIYHSPGNFTAADKILVKKVLADAEKENGSAKNTLSVLEDMWLGAGREEKSVGVLESVDHFFRRLMQFTGPLMAKGLEDTAFYAYNPFLAHNEVGDSPAYFGMDVSTFHEKMIQRRESFPLTLNALSTHDTKRGEDARARLNVLSDLYPQWETFCGTWRKMNQDKKIRIEGEPVPSAADEYLIYQALAGHFPMNRIPDKDFLPRFSEYIRKSLREAKENSSWSDPDTAYEEGTLDFIKQILDPEHDFLVSLQDLLAMIIPHGILNSLTQTILKFTVPGVPDIYQGSETWNLSFVDPDNRRAVSYEDLSSDLETMMKAAEGDHGGLIRELWENQSDGRIKQWITHLLLETRNKNQDVFAGGRYIPLEVNGRYRQHLIAFYRSDGEAHILVVLPLYTAGMPADHTWEETRVLLPDLMPLRWEHIFTKEIIEADREINPDKLFGTLPFAVLRSIPNTPEKRAGILMHITSLPGNYGTGDFGPWAYDFIDFLHRSGQRCWQILPLSPISGLTGYSPYSSRSAFAGNILFIDPDRLTEPGWPEMESFQKKRFPHTGKIDYALAEQNKNEAIAIAYRHFRQTGKREVEAAFQSFTERESYWIHDFALYEVLKSHFGAKAWYEWPEEYRDRHKSVLDEFADNHRESLEEIKFGQFLFNEQWKEIRSYANERGISVFGDIPIYIDHDSADVWAHPELFQLDENKRMTAVAGVPPDYFNEEGQLWGMPLYNWESAGKEGFVWWLKRLERNLNWFDLLRLDHFRGFEAYWEVPGGDKTAKNGKWVRAPGSKFFEAIQRKFPDMPFVAEDLGDISQEVYDLRDRYGLPGMRVIQFGFGEKMAFSLHYPGNIPHNSIGYTGTHDNNTLRGWYRQEAGKEIRRHFQDYTGNKLRERNVSREMIRVAYASGARMVIVPMQDWLNLDEKSRMNFPATTSGNWLWRVDGRKLSSTLEEEIKHMVKTFGRY